MTRRAPMTKGETAMRHTIRDGGTVGRRGRTVAVALVGLVVAASLTACSSTESQPAATSVGSTPATSSGTDGIPSSAFSDTTGLTSTTVSVGNVSTLAFGLFKGADVGTEAWADYVNSTGGINGRKIVVNSYDDGYEGAPNKQETQEVVQNDFAVVGGFSLEDNYGGTVLAANPGVPNVTVNLDQATSDLPNSFSPDPAAVGWPTGPLLYFKQKFPADVQHAGALVADEPSAIDKWNGEKAAMESLGYKVVYDEQFGITQTDFTQNVVAMRQDGIKILFLEQMPENYAGRGGQGPERAGLPPAGGVRRLDLLRAAGDRLRRASAIDGTYMEMVNSLFLGEDENVLPAVKTFQSWVQKADPGFHPDLYTLFGWLSGELFTQALRPPGPTPPGARCSNS